MSDHSERKLAEAGEAADPNQLWLREMLAEEPLEDGGFSRDVLSRVDREGRRRRSTQALVWAGVLITALLGGAFLAALGPGWPDFRPTGAQPLESHHILGLALLSLGLISALWLDTESFGLEI